MELKVHRATKNTTVQELSALPADHSTSTHRIFILTTILDHQAKNWCGTSLERATQALSENRTNKMANTAPSTSAVTKYSCQTQKGAESSIGPIPASFGIPGAVSRNTDSLAVGIGRIIPRWDVSDLKTKLLYFVQTETFPSPGDAKYGAEALQLAADEWNILNIGLLIAETKVEKNAHFNLVYQVSEPDDRTYAMAFFPHEVEQDVIVFSFAYTVEEKDILKNVFVHELGHVLGLRHEFAIQLEGQGAVQFQEANELSVMSYEIPPVMQESDKTGIQAFYKLKNGDKISRKPIVDFIPTPRNPI